jgi:pyruvate kinase
MVARGDLGEGAGGADGPENDYRCNAAGKPVIVATQMMERVHYAPCATRAETSDVTPRLRRRCRMLSAETAVGAYPAEHSASMVAPF